MTLAYTSYTTRIRMCPWCCSGSSRKVSCSLLLAIASGGLQIVVETDETQSSPIHPSQSGDEICRNVKISDEK